MTIRSSTWNPSYSQSPPFGGKRDKKEEGEDRREHCSFELPLVKRVNVFFVNSQGVKPLILFVQRRSYQDKVQLLNPFLVNGKCQIVDIVVDVEL